MNGTVSTFKCINRSSQAIERVITDKLVSYDLKHVLNAHQADILIFIGPRNLTCTSTYDFSVHEISRKRTIVILPYNDDSHGDVDCLIHYLKELGFYGVVCCRMPHRSEDFSPEFKEDIFRTVGSLILQINKQANKNLTKTE